VLTELFVAPHRFCSHRLNQEPVKLRKQKSPMKRLVTLAACATLGVIGTGLVRAQSDAPYTEGSVWGITMVKTKPGMSDDYLKALAKLFKATNDEMKKQGLIMDYKILLGDSSDPHDFDVLLMVEYKNMAAFDGFREKADPISDKILGSEQLQREGAIKRMEIREIMGNKLMREVTLK
jgi:hypothetical protein